MSIEQQDKDIRTEIERARLAWDAAAKGYSWPVEYGNRSTVDLASLIGPYVMADIVWGKSQQMDLGANPLVADYGAIIVAAGVKEGLGTLQVRQILDYLRPYLQLRNPLGTVRTHQAFIGAKPVVKEGFYYLTMTVPFWSVAQAPAVP